MTKAEENRLDYLAAHVLCGAVSMVDYGPNRDPVQAEAKNQLFAFHSALYEFRSAALLDAARTDATN
jgi:hypothetical protein